MIDLKTLQEAIDNNPFSTLLKMEMLEISPERGYGRMPLQKKYLNGYGGMHGGCIYSLADTITGLTAYGNGCRVTTLNGSLNYLLPAVNTKYVYCEAIKVRQGTHIGVYQAKILDDNNNLLAQGEFNYYVISSLTVK